MNKKLILTDDDIMFIGKEHKGKKLKDVPAGFLIWLIDQNWFVDYVRLHNYIKEHLTALEDEVEEGKIE